MKKSTVAFLSALFVAVMGFSGCESTDSVTIPIDIDPKTEYYWDYKIDDAEIVRLKSEKYKRNKTETGQWGVGGVQHFKFKCQKPGSTTVTFMRRGPKDNSEIVETKTATISVDENLVGTVSFE